MARSIRPSPPPTRVVVVVVEVVILDKASFLSSLLYPLSSLSLIMMYVYLASYNFMRHCERERRERERERERSQKVKPDPGE